MARTTRCSTSALGLATAGAKFLLAAGKVLLGVAEPRVRVNIPDVY